MNWNELIIFEVGDLYDYEPEMLAELDNPDRRRAVKNILSSRIVRSFRTAVDRSILDAIQNPWVLKEAGIYLNLQLLFFANAGGGGVYESKARHYSELFEEELENALLLLEFDGYSRSGVTLAR